MAKPHWFHTVQEHPHGVVQLYGCQHSSCKQAATHQWQREATEQEIEADAQTQGPYGSVVRNFQGPHRVAVFACKDHVLENDSMAAVHVSSCPAPDEGCTCHDGN